MKAHEFIFSVVMSVYNVEQFIREAVDSLIHQTIGFDKIQLIFVDDGSKDGSGAICEEYQKRYPENVMIIHKENGGLSSARNAGLPHVTGKYVSFFDPDDILDRNVFEKVAAFMDQHSNEVDVCCIPYYLFGNQTGSHPLNYKFEEGTRVVDLSKEENADCILLSSASAFYRRDIAQKMRFDTNLYTAEDSKANIEVLMNNPKLGIVADVKYHYRKHGNSIVDNKSYQKKWYLGYLHGFSEWALNTATERFGYIPQFVQYTVMYDLQWKFRQGSIPENVLTESEKTEYKKLLIECASRIDEKIILAQKNLSIDRKIYILTQKYGRLPSKRIVSCDDGKALSSNAEYTVGDVELYFTDTPVVNVSQMKTALDFLTIGEDGRKCSLEGYLSIYQMNADDVRPVVIVNDHVVECEITDRRRSEAVILGEKITTVTGFKAEFTLDPGQNSICPAVMLDGVLIRRTLFSYGSFFPISGAYDNAYATIHGKMVTVEDGSIRIGPGKTKLQLAVRESRLLCEIWRKNLLGGRKACFGRLYYHMVKPFKRRRLWIVSDRIMKADDNGEAMYRYILEQKPKNVRVVFAISKNSQDYPRMKKLGECVDAMSFRHKLMHLLCDVNISSQADAVTINPYNGHHDALRDLLAHQKFVFLQHGVTQNDISGWLNRYNKNIHGFITTAVPEYRSIVEGAYDYPEEKVWQTGFPRFDRLYHAEGKKVTIMPTWRQYLVKDVDSRTGIWKVVDGIKTSAYYRFYNGLLNSERLLRALEQQGYTLQFFPHPNIQLAGIEFDKDERVTFLPYQTSYRDVYAMSDLVVSDYSSAVFDFAYLRKPLIYCQFDKEQFFKGDHVCVKGYFDYERDGFGEVTYDLESTIDQIIEYVKNDCQLKDKYRARIDGFFAFNDKNNCKRVLEKIMALPE